MYQERTTIAGLRAYGLCSWVRTDARAQRTLQTERVLIVPDACVDILWTGSALLVAGPDTRPVWQRASATTHGVRLRTGRATCVLGVAASALRDSRVALADLWGDDARRLTDALAATPASHIMATLEAALLARRPHFGPVDPLIAALADGALAEQRTPELRVAALAKQLGVSERQLLRRCNAAVGYGPKMLARVVRAQAFRHAARARPRASLASLAAELGFVDQAHLSHECLELLGRTPAQVRAREVRFPQDHVPAPTPW